ncbi:MAG: tetratricopeptide repeat protein [Nitrospinales bacterium]
MTNLEATLEIQKKNCDVSGQLQTLSLLCQGYQSQRKYQKALLYSKQAIELAKVQINADDQIHAIINMGCVYWEMAQLKKAMSCFQDALTITQVTQDVEGQKKLSAVLGISYWRKGEWPTAFSWFEKSISILDAETSKHDALKVILERGVKTLENRIRMAKDQNDAERTLLPCFSMVPLLYFADQKEKIPHLINEIIPLAQQLNKQNILNEIPKLQNLFLNG